MSKIALKVVADGTVDRGVAQLTRDAMNLGMAEGSLIELSVNNSVAFLSVVENPYGEGVALHARGSDLGLAEGAASQGSAEVVGQTRWRWKRLRMSSSGRLTLAGLSIAILGAVIKLTFAVPDAWVWIEVTNTAEGAAKLVADLLALGGTVLVFINGPWRKGA